MSDYSHRIHTELQLCVDVDLVRNFTKCFLDQQDLTFLQGALKVDLFRVFDEERTL